MTNLPEEVKIEETAAAETVPETEAEEKFFAYDKDYAKKKKTYVNPVWKGASIVLTLALDAFALIGAVMVIPEDSPLLMAALGLVLLIALFAIFVMPSFFNYKIKAPFKSFLAEGDSVWGLEFTPYSASSKEANAAGVNKMFCEECLKTCRSKEAAVQIVEMVRNGEKLGKGKSYKKVSVVCMKNAKLTKAGKNAKVSYADKKGKAKGVKIADCYPGLFEYIG